MLEATLGASSSHVPGYFCCMQCTNCRGGPGPSDGSRSYGFGDTGKIRPALIDPMGDWSYCEFQSIDGPMTPSDFWQWSNTNVNRANTVIGTCAAAPRRVLRFTFTFHDSPACCSQCWEPPLMASTHSCSAPVTSQAPATSPVPAACSQPAPPSRFRQVTPKQWLQTRRV
jgi:hypothetical protein